ncbi:Cu-binding protein [Coemansia biformis]|uniref:Cu-binding protein n=1 Tax=Coemansia biformis TaxID=1286918 RepID=A0A9W8CXM0_9FUNG|nr:Cu-binding protein [Coemansia biformis]
MLASRTYSSAAPPPKDQSPKDQPPTNSPTPGGEPRRRERLLPATGPLSPIGISLFLITAGGILYYFTAMKARVREERIRNRGKMETTGKAEVGGPYTLTDQDGNAATDKTFHGRFALVYFGFCHCPDICPDELDKIGDALDILDRSPETKDAVQPVFITCDPQRDSPEAIKSYLQQFHPKFVGLTGSIDQVRTACKAYRVYFSKPPKVAENQDYLVDHSIFSYFMDPDGQFVDVYGKDKTAQQMADGIAGSVARFRSAGRAIERE